MELKFVIAATLKEVLKKKMEHLILKKSNIAQIIISTYNQYSKLLMRYSAFAFS